MQKILVILCVFCYNVAFSQKSRYSNQCELIRNLLDTADQTFFRFAEVAGDSTITLLDINGVLTECSINTIGGRKINVVNSGAEVAKVKKEGIFRMARRRYVFIFTKEHLDQLTGFRIFYPNSGGQYYWGFIENNRYYYFSKKSCGWF